MTTECNSAFSGRAGRIGEESGAFGKRIDAGLAKRREEGEVVHDHRSLTGDECIIHFGIEGVIRPGAWQQ